MDKSESDSSRLAGEPLKKGENNSSVEKTMKKIITLNYLKKSIAAGSRAHVAAGQLVDGLPDGDCSDDNRGRLYAGRRWF